MNYLVQLSLQTTYYTVTSYCTAVLRTLNLPEILGYDSNDDVDTKLHGDDAL
jgi:hypothetical protein